MGGNEPLSRGVLLRGRYKIEDVVGTGGMGRVYKARDTEYGRFVAVKEMRQDNLQSSKLVDAQKQFEKEATILQRLARHPHIPEIFAFFNEGGRSYLVMQFIEGQNLLQLMRTYPQQQLPIDKVVNYAMQLCDVLSFLHRQIPPIIFRDLKPENVMVSTENSIYLIDFGIARFFNPDKVADTLVFASLGYAAPEAIWGANPGTEPRSDLFSLGATLHHCLTGFHPKNSPQPCYFRRAQDYNKQVSPSLDRLLLKLVSTNKGDRYASADEVLQALRSISIASSNTTLPNDVQQNEPATNPFYDPGTGQALQLYMSLARGNKLPGVWGRLLDKMVPFLTAIGIWYIQSFMPFVRRNVEWIGKQAVNGWSAARRPRKQKQPTNLAPLPAQKAASGKARLDPRSAKQPEPVSPQQPRQAVKKMDRVAAVAAPSRPLSQPVKQKHHARRKATLPQQPSQAAQSPRSSSGIFGSIAGADPVPYLGMLLTTTGISFFMLGYLHISPLPVLFVLLCVLGLFAWISGLMWKMVPIAQNLLGAALACILFAIVMLLALPGVQAVVGMFTFAQLFCVPILLCYLLWLLYDRHTTRRLGRLLVLLVVPFYLFLNQVVTLLPAQATPEASVTFLAMHPFDLTHFNITLFSLLVLLGIEVFFGFVRFSDFLIAQVLASLALVGGSIVFIANWHVAGPDAMNTQANSMQWMQWIGILSALLLLLMIIICLPYREGREDVHPELPFNALRLVVKMLMLSCSIVFIVYFSLRETNQVMPPLGNNAMDESNLELWQFFLIGLIALIALSILFTLWQLIKQDRNIYGYHTRSKGIKKVTQVFSALDSLCLLALIIIAFFFWPDQLTRPFVPSLSLPFHIPTDETAFSLLLIGGVAGLSGVFWLWLQRPMERIKRGALVFYNFFGLLALGLAVLTHVIFRANPVWFDLAMIVAVVFLAQSLLVIMRSERELARVK
ncbi:MAG: protein kinase domain-containing protein [Ktedonobacteraceae bacterium]